jgi:hypothetical protein
LIICIELKDWYNISRHDLLQLGGAGLLDRYNDSLYRLFCAAYPETKWIAHKFRSNDNRGVSSTALYYLLIYKTWVFDRPNYTHSLKQSIQVPTSKGQFALLRLLKSLLPEFEFYSEFAGHNLEYSGSKKLLHLGISCYYSHIDNHRHLRSFFVTSL